MLSDERRSRSCSVLPLSRPWRRFLNGCKNSAFETLFRRKKRIAALVNGRLDKACGLNDIGVRLRVERRYRQTSERLRRYRDRVREAGEQLLNWTGVHESGDVVGLVLGRDRAEQQLVFDERPR